MKHLRTFEGYDNYTSKKPYSFDSVFKITKEELRDYLSEMIDEFDYIDFDIVSDNYESFNLEIYTDNPDENLISEFDWYKKKVSESLKTQLIQAYSLEVISEKYDEERNRIIITVKPEGK